MEEKRTIKKAHNIILEGRRTISVTGVTDVESFDDECIILFTEMGVLAIKGEELHIKKLNIENGEVVVEGTIAGLEYEEENSRDGFFSRIFR